MFKFIAGAVTGWVSARILPPPQETSDRLKPPTSDELYMLAQRIKKVVDDTIDKLDQQSSR